MKTFLQNIQDTRIRSGLHYSIKDGLLWAVMYGVAESYLAPFALLFGATAFQVSLIQGVAFLGVCLAQLVGAKLALKVKDRKTLIVTAVRIHAVSWVFIFLMTVFTGNPWYLILFYLIGMFSTNLGGPAWNSWMNDLIPKRLRGEFWGKRNTLVGGVQFAAMGAAGVLLHVSKIGNMEILAFGFLFLVAFLARFGGSMMTARQYEPEMHITETTHNFHFRIFLTKLRTTNFGRFALFNFFMAFAVNIMAPIINVYVLETLHFSYMQFTALNVAMMVTSFISMVYWGPLSDRFGNYRILTVTTIFLPLVAFAWIFVHNFYLLLLLQCFNGFLMAGMNLAIINYLFDAVLPQNVMKITAYFNTLNNLFAFSGAFLGGYLTKLTPNLSFEWFDRGNFELIFLLSGLIRLFVVISFSMKFREVRDVEKSPSIHYFYIYKPMTSFINRFQQFNERINGNNGETN